MEERYFSRFSPKRSKKNLENLLQKPSLISRLSENQNVYCDAGVSDKSLPKLMKSNNSSIYKA